MISAFKKGTEFFGHNDFKQIEPATLTRQEQKSKMFWPSGENLRPNFTKT